MLFATAEAVLAKYPLHVTATPNASLLCLSSHPLPGKAQAAVAASAERLGYGGSNVAWVVVAPAAGALAAGGSDASGEPVANVQTGEDAGEDVAIARASEVGEMTSSGEMSVADTDAMPAQAAIDGMAVAADASACALPLSENDIRVIVEGIDPVAVVVTDSNAAAMMAEAYKQPLFCDHPCRVAGRSVAPFTNFETLLSTPDSKQKAWALLKELALG